MFTCVCVEKERDFGGKTTTTIKRSMAAKEKTNSDINILLESSSIVP